MNDLPFSKAKQTRNTITVSEFKNLTEDESTLQKQCDNLLYFYPNIKAVRIPDIVWTALQCLMRSKESKLAGIIQKRLSHYFSGMPDYLLLTKNKVFNKACLVELKVKGRRPRQNQKRWVKFLNSNVIETVEAFQSLLDRFLSNNNER